MHETYASKGLAVISVSVDPLYDYDGNYQRIGQDKERELRAGVERFLSKQRATFTNLLLDETDEFWAKKFNIDGPPALYVFDRTGKWVQFKPEGENDIDHKAVEKLVVQLLEEK